MTSRPFRFGLTIGDPRDRDSFVGFVRRAEDTGFDVLAGVDHIGPPLGVLPMLAFAAEVSGLRVSTMVIANDYRHPVLLAKDAATIDVLSDGRFELGIGTGWIESQYDAAGLDYDGAAVRIGRLEEALAVIKGCWRAEQFSFDGRHYRVNLVGSPAPAQRPHPPILVGGGGPQMLRLAGREADIVGITATSRIADFKSFARALATSAERISDQIEWVRDGAGDRFVDLELSVMIHHLIADPDGDDGLEAFAAETATAPDQILRSPHVLVGPPDRMRDDLVELRERYGISYIVFRGPQLEHVAPVVERLSGS